jgi:hypothetical protein
MKRFVLMAVAAAMCALPAGCGSDKADNSKVQTPNDQPIGLPSAPGSGLKAKGLPLDPQKKPK